MHRTPCQACARSGFDLAAAVGLSWSLKWHLRLKYGTAQAPCSGGRLLWPLGSFASERVSW